MQNRGGFEFRKRFTLLAQVGQRHETGGEDSKDVPAQSIRQNLLLNTARAAEAAAGGGGGQRRLTR